jgi:hypothetical protein
MGGNAMATLEDKRAFVAQYAELLRAARVDVADLIMSDDGNTVTIAFTNGYHKPVNIEANSRASIIMDVIRKAMY